MWYCESLDRNREVGRDELAVIEIERHKQTEIQDMNWLR